jgi:hypothetical protein
MPFMARRIKTEQAWLNSRTPANLLSTLNLKGACLMRQRRLFAVACCRRWLQDMLDPESRNAVEVAERHAVGVADMKELVASYSEELRAAYLAAQEVAGRRHAPALLAAKESDRGRVVSAWRLAHAAQFVCHGLVPEDAANDILIRLVELGDQELLDQEKQAQCILIRDIFGNPFRPQPSIDSSRLSWNGGTVGKLAQAIYDDRAFDRLPILADALEEAGCTDADILNHCRQPGEHVRGCWVVDLLLGKS